MMEPITATEMQQGYLSELYNMGCVVFTGAPKATIRERGISFAQDRGISISDFFGTTRIWDVSHPRQEFWASLRPKYSFPQIGRAFRKDHTTIKSGIEAHERRAAQ